MIISHKFFRRQQDEIKRLYNERAELIRAQDALHERLTLAEQERAQIATDRENKENLFNAFNIACNKLDKVAKENEQLFNSQKKTVVLLHEAVSELCIKCGDYKQEHKGACNGCRWKDIRNK